MDAMNGKSKMTRLSKERKQFAEMFPLAAI